MRSNFKIVVVLLVAGAVLAWAMDHFNWVPLPVWGKVLAGSAPAALYILLSGRRSPRQALVPLQEFVSNPNAVFAPKWGAASTGTGDWLKRFVERGADVLVAVDPSDPGISNSVLLFGAPLELEDRADISRLAAEVELLRPTEFNKRFGARQNTRAPIYELKWE